MYRTYSLEYPPNLATLQMLCDRVDTNTPTTPTLPGNRPRNPYIDFRWATHTLYQPSSSNISGTLSLRWQMPKISSAKNPTCNAGQAAHCGEPAGGPSSTPTCSSSLPTQHDTTTHISHWTSTAYSNNSGNSNSLQTHYCWTGTLFTGRTRKASKTSARNTNSLSAQYCRTAHSKAAAYSRPMSILPPTQKPPQEPTRNKHHQGVPACTHESEPTLCRYVC